MSSVGKEFVIVWRIRKPWWDTRAFCFSDWLLFKNVVWFYWKILLEYISTGNRRWLHYHCKVCRYRTENCQVCDTFSDARVNAIFVTTSICIHTGERVPRLLSYSLFFFSLLSEPGRRDCLPKWLPQCTSQCSDAIFTSIMRAGPAHTYVHVLCRGLGRPGRVFFCQKGNTILRLFGGSAKLKNRPCIRIIKNGHGV